MRSASPVVLIGLDACDPATVEQLASQGELPALAALLRDGARWPVRNPYGLFVGSLWVTLSTGLGPARHGFHCWDEIDVQTYERRQALVPDDPGTPFWVTASEAGHRVAVLDVPHSRAARAVDGLHLVEWGCHDRHFGLHSWPPPAADELEAAFGLHPVLGLDAHAVREFAPDDYAHRDGALRRVDEEHELTVGLLAGLARKRRLSRAVLESDSWGLFVTVFGESHAVGHQQWHLHDPAHERFDPAIVTAIGGDPVRRVYRELDAAVAELLDVAAEDATVLVLLSHGMGPHHDGTHLLDEVLRRLDLADRLGHLGRGPRSVLKRSAQRLPSAARRRVVAAATPFVRSLARRRPLDACAEFVSSAQRREQRFFLEPNNFVIGGVRLNLVGREPNGCVHPAEAGSVVTALSEDLLALVNVDTGGPVITAVEPADRWYPDRGVDTMPDVFVEWERSSPIETVWSPKIGLVHAPYTNWRTGDHRPAGLLLGKGPGIPTATQMPTIDAADLAPSILFRLGASAGDVDGRVVPPLAAATSVTR